MQSFSIPALPDIRVARPQKRHGTGSGNSGRGFHLRQKSLYLHRMATKEGFTIEISSRYEGWWRYNVALMCGCFDTAGNRTGFASTEAHVADVGSNLREKPAGNPGGGRASLETGPCDHLLLYIYIVPHTPAGRQRHRRHGTPSKSKSASHTADGRLRAEKRLINQWSGASIEMRVDSEAR